MTTRRHTVNARRPHFDPLENILAGLNELEPRSPESQKLLRELVRQWNECEQNLQQMLNEMPRLAPAIRREWKALLVVGSDGTPCLSITAAPDGSKLSIDARFALELFMNLLIDPRWQMLGGPCRRCHRYFAKKTKRQTVYCSRKCAKDNTAAAATQKRLADQRIANLECAEAAIQEWKKHSRRQDWKRFVVNRCGISLHYLTRAVNRKELRPPENG
jgi:hypothetical protein